MSSLPLDSSSTVVGIQSDDSWIPDGFILVVGPDDKKYIVPEFMAMALDKDYHSDKKKEELKSFSVAGTVSIWNLICIWAETKPGM